MRALVCFVTAILVAATALAQDYKSLEGMTVTARVAMPASQEGLDIHMGTEPQLDVHKAAEGSSKDAAQPPG